MHKIKILIQYRLKLFGLSRSCLFVFISFLKSDHVSQTILEFDHQYRLKLIVATSSCALASILFLNCVHKSTTILEAGSKFNSYLNLFLIILKPRILNIAKSHVNIDFSSLNLGR